MTRPADDPNFQPGPEPDYTPGPTFEPGPEAPGPSDPFASSSGPTTDPPPTPPSEPAPATEPGPSDPFASRGPTDAAALPEAMSPTPEDMVRHVLDQRAWLANAPGTLNEPGEALGTGFSTNSIVQVVDGEGKQVATEWSRYGGRGDAHAEARALDALRERVAGEQFPGGRLVVAVDQDTCPRCTQEIRGFARDHGVESIEVWGPTRGRVDDPSTPVSPKTAGRTAYSGIEGAPPTTAERRWAETVGQGREAPGPAGPAGEPLTRNPTNEQVFETREAALGGAPLLINALQHQQIEANLQGTIDSELGELQTEIEARRSAGEYVVVRAIVNERAYTDPAAEVAKFHEGDARWLAGNLQVTSGPTMEAARNPPATIDNPSPGDHTPPPVGEGRKLVAYEVASYEPYDVGLGSYSGADHPNDSLTVLPGGPGQPPSVSVQFEGMAAPLQSSGTEVDRSGTLVARFDETPGMRLEIVAIGGGLESTLRSPGGTVEKRSWARD